VASEGNRKRPPVTRVLVVDDHRAFSQALGIAIDLQPDLEYVGSASTVEEAIAAVPDSAPDVVLMDLRLPDRDGIEGLSLIKEMRPEVRVLILTAFADADAMARAAAEGACGFFPKERPVGEILQAIRTAGEGGMLVEPSTLAAVLARVREPAREHRKPQGPSLTDRQRDVLALMAEGMDPKSIAKRLGISVNTSRGHVKGILAKLGAHSQLEAVVAALREGLLDIGPSSNRDGQGSDPADPLPSAARGRHRGQT
jgi:DNA-binding NarL/FixJ family response regulator